MPRYLNRTIHRIVLSLLKPKADAFEKAAADPAVTQHRLLLEFIGRNRDTEFGRRYGFPSVKNTDDYRNNVPVSDYEFFRPYIDSMVAGEKNILTKDRAVFFGMTSGTTGLPKLIPNTRYGEHKKLNQLALWTYYWLKAHPGTSDGKFLAMVSPEVEGRTACGVPYGLESGRGYRSLPWFIKGFYAIPYCVFTIKDHNARYYTMLRISIEKAVTNVTSLNPYALILLARKMEQWSDLLIRDVENGTIRADFPIEGHIRARLERNLKPDPGRAEELRQIIKKEGRLAPRFVWKGISLIACWKAGSMGAYLEELAHYFGDAPVRDMGCISTEARSSIPMSDKGAEGALAIQTNFYEFVPSAQSFAAGQHTLTCAEVETGKEYVMIVTTPNGLYRYWTDDVVRVTGFFRKTPVVEFVLRRSGTTSIAGENLSESQVNAAIMSSVFSTEFFCAVARASIPAYEFLAEFKDSLSGEEEVLFLQGVDDAIRKVNSVYKYCRDAELLKSPVLKVIKKGSFAAYHESLVLKGAPDGQIKAPVLTADESFASHFDVDRIVRIS